MENGFECFQCRQKFEGSPAVVLRNGPTCLNCKKRMDSRRNSALPIWRALGIKGQDVTDDERNWIRNVFIDRDGWPLRDIPESRGGMLSVLIPLIDQEKKENPLLASKLSLSVIEQTPTVTRRNPAAHELAPKAAPPVRRRKWNKWLKVPDQPVAMRRGGVLPLPPRDESVNKMAEILDRLTQMLPTINLKETPLTVKEAECLWPAQGKKPTKAFIHYECTSQQKQINLVQECLKHAQEVHESSGRTHEASGKLLKVLAARLALTEREVQRLKGLI